MTTKEIKETIRDICTYHADGGTSGHLLDEDRFAKIFNLIDEQSLDFEKVLANVIDDLYLANKKNFCGGRPHKLGQFKEQIKARVHEELNKIK